MSLLTNLVSYWKFDEASGTALADAHGANNGTLAGTEAWVTGKLGNAFDFNQASRFNCGTDNSLNLTAALTVAAWVNVDDLGENSAGRIFDRISGSTGFALLVADGGGGVVQPRVLRAGSTSTASTATLTPGVWYHVAATISGTSYAFFVNASAAGTGSLEGAINSASAVQGTIGGNAAADRDFDGRIDELAIWGRALSATEIAALYNGGDGLEFEQFFAPRARLGIGIGIHI